MEATIEELVKVQIALLKELEKLNPTEDRSKKLILCQAWLQGINVGLELAKPIFTKWDVNKVTITISKWAENE